MTSITSKKKLMLYASVSRALSRSFRVFKFGYARILGKETLLHRHLHALDTFIKS